jgi:hypothetical protein
MATATETMQAEILALEKLVAALEGGRIAPEDRPALLHNCKAMLGRKQRALAAKALTEKR